MKKSGDLILYFLYTIYILELPAGQISEFLVGFSNTGSQEMVVEALEASLRYPMDFTYHLQGWNLFVCLTIHN